MPIHWCCFERFPGTLTDAAKKGDCDYLDPDLDLDFMGHALRYSPCHLVKCLVRAGEGYETYRNYTNDRY